MNIQFRQDVHFGLSLPQKQLSSKYFYDKTGDELFMQIMQMPEYYLTRAEAEIFSQQSEQMIDLFGLKKDQFFELIELGAGDGTKTQKLLATLSAQHYDFDYIPIDISGNVLEHLEVSLAKQLPDVSVKVQQGDYFEALAQLHENHNPKVILFLGSNIGNQTDAQATKFIYDLGANLNPGDKLLIGVDRVKPEYIVLPAYDDKSGVTKAFNLNLLQRINNELGGDFIIDQFEHAPEYDEEEGVARSFLVSKVNQVVSIASLEASYHFKKDERIHMEISRKYTNEILHKIIKDTDFEIIGELSDSKNYFSDFILERF